MDGDRERDSRTRSVSDVFSNEVAEPLFGLGGRPMQAQRVKCMNRLTQGVTESSTVGALLEVSVELAALIRG